MLNMVCFGADQSTDTFAGSVSHVSVAKEKNNVSSKCSWQDSSHPPATSIPASPKVGKEKCFIRIFINGNIYFREI